MKMSLRNRFMLPVLLLVSIGMVLSTVVASYKSKNALIDANNNQITQLSESTLNMLVAWSTNRTLEVSNWSRQKVYREAVEDTFVGRAARKSANSQLARLKADYKFYESIVVFDSSGDIVAASDEWLMESEDVDFSPFFTEGMEGSSHISDVIISPISGSPVFAVSYPILGKDTMVSGVFSGIINVNHFKRQFIEPIKVGASGYAFIIKQDGVCIAHPDQAAVMKANVKDLAFGSDVLEKRDGLLESELKGDVVTVAFKTDNVLGWTIGIIVPTKEILGSVRSVWLINMSVTSAIIILMAVLILLLVSSTVRPINRSIQGLERAVEQVTTGAGEVAFSSQTLSNGASHQAASIEETSASLKQMAAMTSQNADHAGEAKSKMNEVSTIIEKVNTHMAGMTSAIDEITRSSEETNKIIKTIDEIAFQTNLLSLNAAVEAARAGEAGAGFAVVADEVRRLAKKSADAAKSTAELIEKTIKSVQNGAALTSGTQEAFQENIEISKTVAGLVQEIAAASSEQAKGISEISRAVTDMDNVVHQVAATAEESASASEEMSGQSEEMKGFVRNLAAIVYGDRNVSAGRFEKKTALEPGQKRLEEPSATDKKPDVSEQQQSESILQHLPSPEEEDFKDF